MKPGDLAHRPALIEALCSTRRQEVHGSAAIREVGYAPAQRMLIVRFASSATLYGYPDLSDAEIQTLLQVLQDGQSLGHFVATVIKPAHDHERVQG